MRIFITGGTGFIGSHLVDFLAGQKEAEVFILARNPEKARWLAGRHVHFLKGDLFSIPALPRDISTVYHLAGLTKSIKSAAYYTVNQEGTASLFQSLLEQNVSAKVICLSSLAAAGPSPQGKAVKENVSPCPVTPYGKSKWLGEEEALKYKDKFPLVIVRVGAVFGPRDKDFLNFFKMAQKGVLPAIDIQASICYVKDLVRALALCAEKRLESGEIINIGNPDPVTTEDICRAAGEALGKSLKKIKFPFFLIYLIALYSDLIASLRREATVLNLDKYKELKQRRWVADVEKAAALLSFRTQYSLEEAVKETIAWYKENGWI